VSDLTYDDVCMRVCIYYTFSEIHQYILILGSLQSLDFICIVTRRCLVDVSILYSIPKS
jgi:hypothetical protein